MHIYPVRHGKTVRRIVLPLAITAAVAALFIYGIARVSRSAAREQQAVTEHAIQRALVNCYAIEGVYPADLAYLEEHYGLRIDHDRFVIDYDSFASNIRPAVRVVPRGEGRYLPEEGRAAE